MSLVFTNIFTTEHKIKTDNDNYDYNVNDGDDNYDETCCSLVLGM